MQPKDLLKSTAHLPWPIPDEPWIIYQEWRHLLFAHWRVPVDDLRPLVPQGLPIDTFEGEAWVSLLPFWLQKIRPRFIPPFPPVSNFIEINVRTYVTVDNKPGIYFLSIEAQKRVSAWLARTLSGLPYVKSETEAHFKADTFVYSAKYKKKAFSLVADFDVRKQIHDKSSLDRWLCDRYCLYVDRGHKLYRQQIYHQDWPLHHVELNKLEADYQFGNISLSRLPTCFTIPPE